MWAAWNNMLEPDPEKRAANLRYVVECLALADAGGRCCVNIAGTFAGGRGPHPNDLSQKFFDATVENCRRVLDEAAPKAYGVHDRDDGVVFAGWSRRLRETS